MPARVMRAVLTKALVEATLVDQAKKALFYGKDGSTLAAFREEVLLTRELRPTAGYPAGDVEGGLARIHAALGMRSEADEILRHELTLLNHGAVAHEDLVDEIGDLGWYKQLYLNELRVSAVAVVRRNVAKLLKRFNGLAFNAEAAKNPDKAAEAKAQAGAA